MKAEGLRGIPREKTRKTTIGDGAETERPEDLVNRKFISAAPNQLWVADLTYVLTHAGWTSMAHAWPYPPTNPHPLPHSWQPMPAAASHA
jgi:transposase InsO family protein